MVHFSLNNKVNRPPPKGHVAKDTSKFPVTGAFIFRIFYLAYEDTSLIVMTAGHGAHCKEKNSCNISF